MNQTYRVLVLTPYTPADYRKTPEKKMLKKDERNHYVYENKGKKDKMPDEKSDIYVDTTRLLQKKAPYDDESGVCNRKSPAQSMLATRQSAIDNSQNPLDRSGRLAKTGRIRASGSSQSDSLRAAAVAAMAGLARPQSWQRF